MRGAVLARGEKGDRHLCPPLEIAGAEESVPFFQI